MMAKNRLSTISLLFSAILTLTLFVGSFLFSPLGLSFNLPFSSAFSQAGAADYEASVTGWAGPVFPGFNNIPEAAFSNPLGENFVGHNIPADNLGVVGLSQNDDNAMLTLFSIQPPIARPGDDVSVAVRVTNTTNHTIVNYAVALRLSTQIISTRSGLETWINEEVEIPTNLVVDEVVPELLPGSAAEFVFRIPADEFHDLRTTRGPRPMAVTLVDDTGSIADQLNTIFIWDPGAGGIGTGTTSRPGTVNAPPAPLRLSFIAPVTGALVTPSQMDFIFNLGTGNGLPDMPLLFADNQRLTNIVDAATQAGTITGNHEALTLVVDPALIALAGRTDGADQPPTWVDKLATAAEQGVRIHPLPPFDPDLAALAHANVSSAEFHIATHANLPTDWHQPTNWHAPIAWPADWLIPDVVTARAAANEFDLFLVPAGMRARWGTTSGVATFPGENHNITMLVNDDRLAATFYGATDSHAIGLRDLTDNLQKFLAELAIIIDQTPESPPHLLVALPRDWNPNLNATHIAFETLNQIDWINVLSVNTLVNSPVPQVDRFDLPHFRVHPGELPPSDVQRLVAARHHLESYISAVTEPDKLISQAEPVLMLPLSVSWREYYLTNRIIAENSDTDLTGQNLTGQNLTPENLTALRSQMVEASLNSSTLTAGSMEITATGLTIISDTGSIPLNIHNNLPSDAVVRVVLTPQDSRLLVENQPLVPIAAGSTQLVYVPVTAIASGDMLVSVEIQAENGAVITQSQDLELRIRAGWETLSTGVIALLLGVLFVTGIVRTVSMRKKRGKAPTRTSATTVGDPLILDRS